MPSPKNYHNKIVFNKNSGTPTYQKLVKIQRLSSEGDLYASHLMRSMGEHSTSSMPFREWLSQNTPNIKNLNIHLRKKRQRIVRVTELRALYTKWQKANAKRRA